MPEKTEKALFNDAFRELRKLGYIAKQNFCCCQGCGWSALSKSLEKSLSPDQIKNASIVFYHAQDNEAWLINRPRQKTNSLQRVIWLAWGNEARDASDIVAVLKKHGLNAVWDGSADSRIAVHPIGQAVIDI